MTSQPTTRSTACFFEASATVPLVRRAFAEGVGTMLLTIIVGAANAAGSRPYAIAPGLGVAAALTALIVTFGPVSGGHFNPLITTLQWLDRRRGSDCFAAYLTAQLSGAIAGAVIASLMFPTILPVPEAAAMSARRLANELAATAGLMMVVQAVSKAVSPNVGPFAAGAWVAMINLTLPVGALANPALVVAALVRSGGHAPLARLEQAAAEIAGAGIAFIVIAYAYAPAAGWPIPQRLDRSSRLTPT